MRYDLDKLRDEVNALDVAEYIGMEIYKRGSRNYIYCPGHEARLGTPDRTADNCLLRDKGYHCFACNASVDTFDMIVEYCGCTLYEAFGIAADSAGGRHLFQSGKDGEEPKVLPISKKDLELIGLSSRKRRVKTIIGSGYMEREDCISVKSLSDSDDQLDDYYLYYKLKEVDTLHVLYCEDPDLFKEIIVKKAEEAIKKYKFMMDEFCNADSELSYATNFLMGRDADDLLDGEFLYSLRAVYKEKYDRAREILLTYI